MAQYCPWVLKEPRGLQVLASLCFKTRGHDGAHEYRSVTFHGEAQRAASKRSYQRQKAERKVSHAER